MLATHYCLDRFSWRSLSATAFVAASSYCAIVTAETREEFIQKVRVGMTKEQVRDLIGMPMSFSEEKWRDVGRQATWKDLTVDQRHHTRDAFVNVFIDDEGNVSRITFVVERYAFERKLPRQGASQEDVMKAIGPPDVRTKKAWTYEACTFLLTNGNDPERQVLGGNWEPNYRADQSVDVLFDDNGRFSGVQYDSQ